MTGGLAVFLWANVILYAGFGLFCLVKPAKASSALGLCTIRPRGLVEFLTVYGGMQIAFAAFFTQAALSGGTAAVEALWFAVCLYVPLALIRWISIVRMRQAMPALILLLGVMEALMAMLSIALAWALLAGRG